MFELWALEITDLLKTRRLVNLDGGLKSGFLELYGRALSYFLYCTDGDK